MVPFFGGRSIMWSAWCPRPLESVLRGWPGPVMKAAQKHFESAEKLPNVIATDKIDAGQSADALKLIAESRPVYGTLQKKLRTTLAEGLGTITSAPRSTPATLVPNSFPQVPAVGKYFNAHFITSVGAGMPRTAYDFGQKLAKPMLAVDRFRGHGLWVLEEPESALTFSGCLALLGVLKDLLATGKSQVILSTHSPVLAALPGAQILEVGPWACGRGNGRTWTWSVTGSPSWIHRSATFDIYKGAYS